MKATIDVEPSIENTYVAPFAIGKTVWGAASEALADGKPYLWFNGRVWLAVRQAWPFDGREHVNAIATDLTERTLPASVVDAMKAAKR